MGQAMSNVDTVAVARRCIEAPLNERQEPIAASSIGVQAMARVVLAASEFVAATDAANTAALGHDAIGPHWAKRNAAYDALAAALKAE